MPSAPGREVGVTPGGGGTGTPAPPPPAPPERQHRSISQLREYQRCGVAYRFHRLEGVYPGATTPMIRGRAFHEGAAFNFTYKTRQRVDRPLPDVLDATAEAVDAAFRDSIELLPEERSVGIDNLLGRVVDEAVRMQRSFHLRAAPHIQPTMVERKIRVRPPADVFPHDLVGILDLADDHRDVIELKTGRPWTQEDADRDHQLTMEAMLYRAAEGTMPARTSVISVSPGGAGVPRVTRLDSRRDSTDVRTLLLTLNAAERGIQAGVFYPTDPGNYWCSARWCSFWNICPFVKSGARRPQQGGVHGREESGGAGRRVRPAPGGDREGGPADRAGRDRDAGGPRRSETA